MGALTVLEKIEEVPKQIQEDGGDADNAMQPATEDEDFNPNGGEEDIPKDGHSQGSGEKLVKNVDDHGSDELAIKEVELSDLRKQLAAASQYGGGVGASGKPVPFKYLPRGLEKCCPSFGI